MIPATKVKHRNFFHTIANASGLGIIKLSAQGDIINWNPGARKITGYTAIDVDDMNIGKLYLDNNRRDNILEKQLSLAATNGVFETEQTILKKNGSLCHVRINYTPLLDDADTLTGFAMILIDLSERKNTDLAFAEIQSNIEERIHARIQHLENQNKELETFSYTVSHDLKAPLRAINGYSSILKNNYRNCLNNEGTDILDNITDNVKRMGQLIDDLLSFARINNLEAEKEEVNMQAIVQQCIKELSQNNALINTGIMMKDLPAATADAKMIKQVWMNLIDNTVKYSAKTGNPEISIGALTNSDTITYFVKDNGIGFNADFADKIFKPFKRLYHAAEYEGSGIGLSTVYKIIGKHNGNVWAQSEPGKGATFYFSLPVAVA
jgi:PAS domain S-box-containing protein